MRPIFLIGFMGSGKSTLGRLVSRATGIAFIDLDNYIEGRFSRSISTIFAESGEDGFRDIERRMLHEVAEMEDVLVACGGGTPCFFDNIDYMNSKGTTVWLSADNSVLHSRLMRGRHKRPLIASLDSNGLTRFIVDALARRDPFYSRASCRFETSLLETETDREDTAARFIEQYVTPSITPRT